MPAGNTQLVSLRVEENRRGPKVMILNSRPRRSNCRCRMTLAVDTRARGAYGAEVAASIETGQ